MITGFPTLSPLVAKPFNQFFKPSQLPEYTAFATNMRHYAKSITRTILCCHRYPITPRWREAIIVKCLAQAHKCQDRDSNPHSAEQKH